jgi:hypothetical protein
MSHEFDPGKSPIHPSPTEGSIIAKTEGQPEDLEKLSDLTPIDVITGVREVVNGLGLQYDSEGKRRADLALGKHKIQLAHFSTSNGEEVYVDVFLRYKNQPYAFRNQFDENFGRVSVASHKSEMLTRLMEKGLTLIEASEYTVAIDEAGYLKCSNKTLLEAAREAKEKGVESTYAEDVLIPELHLNEIDEISKLLLEYANKDIVDFSETILAHMDIFPDKDFDDLTSIPDPSQTNSKD